MERMMNGVHGCNLIAVCMDLASLRVAVLGQVVPEEVCRGLTQMCKEGPQQFCEQLLSGSGIGLSIGTGIRRNMGCNSLRPRKRKKTHLRAVYFPSFSSAGWGPKGPKGWAGLLGVANCWSGN